jgi:chemotaxis protein methyltransferase WspC
MGLAELADLLKASMGLSEASIGSAAIERAVQERQSLCSLDDRQAYLEEVRGSAAELQALIEAVVVAESWFFRDRHAFTALARLASEEWLPTHPEGVFSILSLPCSTGEEPYSMAMALVDASVPAQRFRIDAVDISTRNIAMGVRAVYGRNSFRGDELGFRDRYFDVTPGGFRVREHIRQQVKFQQGNLFAADLLPGVAIYDAIFCRNVLIYFDRPTQDRAIAVLNRLLHARGMLFVAPAETGLPTSHDLVSTREPLAFAFRKAGAMPSARTPKRGGTALPAVPLAPVRRLAPLGMADLSVRVASAPTNPPAASLPAPSVRPSGDLGEASRLADQGHFAEAADCCEWHLRHSGPSATAFYLLGLVRDATGNHGEAAAYYRKALYLDPNHYDSQIHLALLLERRGDSAAAQVLRNRTRRLEQKRQALND